MVSSKTRGYHPSSSSPAFSQFPEPTSEGEGGGMDSTSASASSSNASREMAVTPDRGSHYTMHTSKKSSSEDALNPIVHVRQKVGKDQGYIPVSSKDSQRRPPSLKRDPHRGMTSEVSPQPVPISPDVRSSPEIRGSDNEMPFDVLNHMIIRERSTDGNPRTQPEPRAPTSTTTTTTTTSVAPTTPPRSRISASKDDPYLSPASTRGFDSVWESSPDKEKPQFYEHGRFEMRQPRFSGPSTVEAIEDELQEGTSALRKTTRYEDYDVVPARKPSNEITQRTDTEPMDESEISMFDESLSPTSKAPHLPDEDSLFDFEEEAHTVEPQFPEADQKSVKVTHKTRRRARQPKQTHSENDDTSVEMAYGAKIPSPTNLQERAQQAWKSRRHKNSSLRSNESPKRTKAANVSFGKMDTVIHFQPDAPNDEDDEETYCSYDDRSLNSEYTKTLESEVEDMIKDILFIGNSSNSTPGRRKLKYKHDVKRKLKKRQEDSEQSRKELSQEPPSGTDEEDITAVSKFRVNVQDNAAKTKDNDSSKKRGATQSDGDEAIQGQIQARSRSTDEAEKEGDPLSAVWNFVEGGMTAMTSALGLTDEETKAVEAEIAVKSSGVAPIAKQKDADCTDQLVPFETCTGKVTPVQNQKTDSKAGMQEMIEYAQDFWYGPVGESNSIGNSGSRSVDDDGDGNDYVGDIPFSLSNMEDDPNLVKLAVHAARSLHQLRGADYNDALAIDMHTDVKISVAELKLPLGLIFLENDGGCFVTKISPDGSAARSGGVEVGDQLAAINERSSMKMKVDDICSMIKNSPDPKKVELVFLRYVGPFRPSKKSHAQASFDLDYGGTHGSFEVPMGESTPPRIATKTTADSPTKKKKGFRLFGRGKKKGQKGK